MTMKEEEEGERQEGVSFCVEGYSFLCVFLMCCSCYSCYCCCCCCCCCSPVLDIQRVMSMLLKDMTTFHA